MNRKSRNPYNYYKWTAIHQTLIFRTRPEHLIHQTIMITSSNEHEIQKTWFLYHIKRDSNIRQWCPIKNIVIPRLNLPKDANHSPTTRGHISSRRQWAGKSASIRPSHQTISRHWSVVSCVRCAGAGRWAWIPGGGLRSAPFSIPNIQPLCRIVFAVPTKITLVAFS